MRTTKLIAATFALGAAAACATTDAPQSEMAAARARVAQAQPLAQADAPQELAVAQAKLERAEVAMQRGHHEHARLLAEQAETDARLALAVAENARTGRALSAELAKRPQ